MKIYLLMLLIGTLLTAIHFTSAPEQRSKTLPQVIEACSITARLTA